MNLVGLSALSSTSCGASVPDPRGTAQVYATAIQQKDARAIFLLLDTESQRVLGEKRVLELLSEARAELEQRALAVAGPDAEVEAQAELRFSDGEVVHLELEDGEFRLGSALAFPSAAHTPVQALQELRAALARRSYASLLLVLSEESRGALEHQMGDLVTALQHPESLDIVVRGDRATVTTPGGHRIELRNEQGVWKIQDFE